MNSLASVAQPSQRSEGKKCILGVTNLERENALNRVYYFLASKFMLKTVVKHQLLKQLS